MLLIADAFIGDAAFAGYVLFALDRNSREARDTSELSWRKEANICTV